MCGENRDRWSYYALECCLLLRYEGVGKEYNKAVDAGRFVKNTDWRAIARHEVGHVVANIYGIDSMRIAMKCFGENKRAKVLFLARRELSIYSAEYEDGREIISESFSGYYNQIRNSTAIESFRMWLRQNGHPDNPVPINFGKDVMV